MKKNLFWSKFSIKLFFSLFLILVLMSGIHMGIVTFMHRFISNAVTQVIVVVIYWVLVALLLTYYTSMQVWKTYEKPVQDLANATSRVASGDFSVYISPIHPADELDYIDYMIMDFNKMVEELGSIEILKTDFFSNVSHEIKTPLAVIQNTAELLLNSNFTNDVNHEYIKIILQSSKRLSNLITNILKLNKLERQTILPVPVEYDLSRQLCDCALQFENVWEEKNIEFDVDIEDSIFIESDEGLLDLVWANLISNALKFTPNGGRVTLSEKSSDDMVIVSISDSGCGLDDKTKGHIFDKFYQGDSSHSGEGNGLGLALVWRILELCDGEISVTSIPQEGSSFVVKLPKMLRKD